MADQYNTITTKTPESLYKVKGSKFFGYAYPVTNEDQIKELLVNIKKQHPKARHWCYAWSLGTEEVRTRANDDGEPSNTAGQPILRQIISRNITNVLVVSVRYFGGVKLGVGGLISAYGESAHLSLEEAKIITKDLCLYLKLRFGYDLMNNAQRIIKQHQLTISQQDLLEDCTLVLEIPKAKFEVVNKAFNDIYGIHILKNI